ncbi:MAG: hypothetical protein AMXMBFR57_07410 [Acidimicrobiia bacterium]
MHNDLMRALWCLVALAVSTPAPQARVDTSPRAVVARATESLAALQTAMEFVLADEQGTQEVFRGDGTRTGIRTTTGDFFLAYVEADGGWLSVRDLAVVDDKPVEARDDLRALLTRGSMARIGRALADRNARYNIGPVVRNFNDPMLALVILSPKHQSRFRFSRKEVTSTGDATLVRLEITERDRPTLIHGTNGQPVFTRGELLIDAVTGQLRRSIFRMEVGPTSAELDTTFELVERLNLWLPSRMDERYEHRTSRERVTVKATSTYTNYRRFETTARIK